MTEPGLAAGALIERMDTARRVIEEKFLGVGTVLSQAVEGIGTMIAALEKLTETLDPATIAATTADLTGAATRLSALPAEQARRRTLIDQLGAHHATLAARVFDMRRSLSYMRAFTVNIKITAGGIASADAEFAHFAQDIARCVELCGDELKGLDADVTALQRELQRGTQQGVALEQKCGELIPAIPDALTASAKVMGDHHGRIAEAARRAAPLARAIRTTVARTLAALQIGDITRQRIEHIQAGASLAEAGGPGLSPAQTARLQALVHALLAEQLTATMKDFSREVSEINRSMAGLAGDLGELLRLRDLAYGRMAGESDGFLRSLERRVAQALDLVGAIAVADQAAVATGHATVNAGQALTARLAAIETIKSDVQYMAINTNLRSTRIGEAGRPLSVIAVELRSHGSQLERSAVEFVAVLAELSKSAAALAGGEAGADGNQTQDAAMALTTAATRIRDAADSTEGDIAALADQGEAALAQLQQPASPLGLRSAIGETLDAVAADLAVLGEEAAPCDEAVKEALQALLAKLGALYTMAQEREVQQRFAEAWDIGGASEPAAAPAKAAVDDLEDALF